MKFLHLSDLHIGKIVNGYSMIDDQAFALQGLLNIAKERDVDAVVLAGDIYDKTAPSGEAVSLFDRFLSDLSEAGIPCIGIPGNHDSAERIAYAQSILAKQGVHFSPVYNGEIVKVQFEASGQRVTFWLMPYLKPSSVKRFFPEMEIGDDYTAAIRAALSNCDLDQAACNVLVAHQFVTASGNSTERAADEINLGGIDNVDASVFDAFDYVALGHVHRGQRVGRDQVRYAGSLLKYSLSEVRYQKTAVLVEVGEKAAGDAPGACISYELVPIPLLHDMREITGPLQALLSAEAVNSASADDYLFACLTDEVPQIDAMAQLQAVYSHVMGLRYEFESRSGAQDDTFVEDLNIEQLDYYDLFSQFFAKQTGKELTDEQARLAQEAITAAREASYVGERVSESAGDAQ